jgi:hypothetical protein
MDRSHLQKLANERIAEAKVLLAAKKWSGAYYLAGYAVECGLKSCVLVRVGVSAEVIFSDRKFSEKCWTHNLKQLVDLAGLTAALKADMVADQILFSKWDTVKDWSEESRYTPRTKREAEALYDAIADKRHGVLSWTKVRW